MTKEYTRDAFFKQYEEICNSASDTLFHKGMDFFDKLAPSERVSLCDGNTDGFRLAKIILVVMSECIETEYSSEVIKSAIKKARRIDRTRC